MKDIFEEMESGSQFRLTARQYAESTGVDFEGVLQKKAQEFDIHGEPDLDPEYFGTIFGNPLTLPGSWYQSEDD